MLTKSATSPSDAITAPWACQKSKYLNLGAWSNALSCLLLLSGFWTNRASSMLLEITVAAGLTLVVHAGLLIFSPPDKQNLSSLILCLIAGPLSVWNGLTWLWIWEKE